MKKVRLRYGPVDFISLDSHSYKTRFSRDTSFAVVVAPMRVLNAPNYSALHACSGLFHPTTALHVRESLRDRYVLQSKMPCERAFRLSVLDAVSAGRMGGG